MTNGGRCLLLTMLIFFSGVNPELCIAFLFSLHYLNKTKNTDSTLCRIEHFPFTLENERL